MKKAARGPQTPIFNRDTQCCGPNSHRSLNEQLKANLLCRHDLENSFSNADASTALFSENY